MASPSIVKSPSAKPFAVVSVMENVSKIGLLVEMRVML